MSGLLGAMTGVYSSDYSGIEGIINEILVPDCVYFLISEDYVCDIRDGCVMAWLSDSYGEREFPKKDECRVLEGLQKDDSRTVRGVLKTLESHETALL